MDILKKNKFEKISYYKEEKPKQRLGNPFILNTTGLKNKGKNLFLIFLIQIIKIKNSIQ